MRPARPWYTGSASEGVPPGPVPGPVPGHRDGTAFVCARGVHACRGQTSDSAPHPPAEGSRPADHTSASVHPGEPVEIRARRGILCRLEDETLPALTLVPVDAFPKAAAAVNGHPRSPVFDLFLFFVQREQVIRVHDLCLRVSSIQRNRAASGLVMSWPASASGLPGSRCLSGSSAPSSFVSKRHRGSSVPLPLVHRQSVQGRGRAAGQTHSFASCSLDAIQLVKPGACGRCPASTLGRRCPFRRRDATI